MTASIFLDNVPLLTLWFNAIQLVLLRDEVVWTFCALSVRLYEFSGTFTPLHLAEFSIVCRGVVLLACYTLSISVIDFVNLTLREITNSVCLLSYLIWLTLLTWSIFQNTFPWATLRLFARYLILTNNLVIITFLAWTIFINPLSFSTRWWLNAGPYVTIRNCKVWTSDTVASYFNNISFVTFWNDAWL